MTDIEPPCFAFLGLRPEADKRTVKRAYAQLLKKTRPDDDPAGFQALHENYQAALGFIAWQAHRAAEAATKATDSSEASAVPAAAATHDAEGAAASYDTDVETPPENGAPLRSETAAPGARRADVDTRADLTARPQPTFDLPAFYADLLREAAQQDALAFTHWLRTQPALWSLELKSEVGARVLNQFFQDAPPMGEEQFDALLAFFDLDHVFAVRDPLALDNVRNAMAIRKALSDPNAFSLEMRMRETGGFHGSQTAQIMQALRRPFSFATGFFEAVFTGKARNYARFMHVATRGHFGLLTPPVDARWPRFWVKASGRLGTSWLHTGIGLARCTLIALAVATLVALGYTSRNALRENLPEVARIGGFTWLGLCALWLGYVGIRLAVAWQGLPQRDVPGWTKWLRLSFVPLLCLVGLAFVVAVEVEKTNGPLLGKIVAPAAVLWIAVRRYRIRAQSPPIRWRFDIRLIVLPVFFIGSFLSALVEDARRSHAADGMDLLSAFGCFMLGLSLLTWLADLWKQRRHLHWHRGMA